MLIALLLPVLLQPRVAAPKPVWTGDFTITMKGSGTIDQRLSTGVNQQVAWKVDRVARGRIVLDRSFKGGGIAGTPNTRDTRRYETWIADSRQPIEMVVSDSSTYFGPIVTPRNITLDVARWPTLGRLCVGCNADVVILSPNPIDDIRNVRRIRSVVADGRPYASEWWQALFARALKEAAAHNGGGQ